MSASLSKKSATKTKEDEVIEKFLDESAPELVDINLPKPHPANPRKGNVARLRNSIKTNGFHGRILLQRGTDYIVIGKHRWQACAELKWKHCRVTWATLTDEEAERLALADNISSDTSSYDNNLLLDALLRLRDTDRQLLGTGMEEEDIDYLMNATGRIASQKQLKALAGDSADDLAPDNKAQQQADAKLLEKTDIGDFIFPPDDSLAAMRGTYWDAVKKKHGQDSVELTLGIPKLNLKHCAKEIDLPVVCFNTQRGRNTASIGTLLFYTTDDHLESLWRNPHKVINTKAVNCNESNFSIMNQTPLPVALWHLYRKRWLSALFGQHGLKLIVDVNVPQEYWHLNLVGVPKGWRAYSTRMYLQYIESGWIDEQFKRCCEHAGTNDIVFLCYGGSNQSERYALKQGWLWIPEDLAVTRGKHVEQSQNPKGKRSVDD